MKPMIKAAIFDMDGLLVDSEPLWQEVMEKIYRDVLGIELTNEHHIRMTGQRTLDNLVYLFEQHGIKDHVPEKVEETINEEVTRLIRKDIALMPGADQALTVCRKAGLPVAIASSANPVVIDAVVDALEIRDHFDHIYSAYYEEYGKPHPAVFLKVAKHFKVPPHECVVFEDSPAGVIAAKAARMVCVAVPNMAPGTHPFIRTADVVLESLEEFDDELLKKLQTP